MTIDIMALQALIIVGCVIVAFAVWHVITRYFVERYNMKPDPEHIIGNYDQLPGFLLQAIYIVLNFVLLLASSFVVLLTPILLGGIALALHDPLVALLSQPWAIIVTLAAGILFYRLRGSMPLIYGIAEIVVAAVTMWLAIVHSADLGTKSLALVGAIYIMLRGLDNVDGGLPQGLRALWDRWFPKST
jgi:hypothetical protein